MGTRNITRVINNGEVIVEQYCQWDGYPTGRGADVLRFVKEYCGGKLSELKRKLGNSTLYSAKAGVALYTGGPPTGKIMDKLCDYVPKYETPKLEDLKNFINEGIITKEEADRLVVASRNRGPEVLEWLMTACDDGLIFYTTEYASSITDELDWQIEGLFTINCDEEWVEINYHGEKKRYTFEKVYEMDINKEMNRFENQEDRNG